MPELKVCTLVLLIRDNEILLAMKKRGFGMGLWNGVGGKIKKGETIEQALIRESIEEISVEPTEYTKVAVHDFTFADGVPDMQVHAYLATKWQGEPTESEEMAPQWFKQSEIPYDQMWQDDLLWMPLVLRGKKLKTSFAFTKNNELLSANIDIIDRLP